jgi:hypothetical protein
VQPRRGPSEQWVERFARIYTPAVLALAILVLLVPPLLLGAPWSDWLYRGFDMGPPSLPALQRAHCMDRKARNRREFLLREARSLVERFELRAKGPRSAIVSWPFHLTAAPVRASYGSCAGAVGGRLSAPTAHWPHDR